MIAVAEARRRLLEAVEPLEAVTLDVEQALGLVTVDEHVADRDYPPSDRSAMDGYAVRAADVGAAGTVLEVVGEAAAGRRVDRLALGPGTAVRIFTGAMVPGGADAVVMVEHTEPIEGRQRVRVLEPVRRGQHIRRAGEDYARGQRVLPAGTPLHSAEAGALATLGVTRVRVHRRPRVAVLSTGDEVVEPAATPGVHQIRNGNAPALLARLGELGAEGRYLGIAGDDAARLGERLERGFAADALLVTGGVSVGEYDLVRQALETRGVEVLFHGVAMKPGKPVLAALREGRLVVGLPGNPVSAVTGLDVLVAPALRRMMGHRDDVELRVRAVLDAPLSARGGRTTFHLGRLEWREGRWRARPVRSASSGDALSMVRANAYLITPAGAGPSPAGDEVEVLPWFGFQLRRAID